MEEVDWGGRPSALSTYEALLLRADCVDSEPEEDDPVAVIDGMSKVLLPEIDETEEMEDDEGKGFTSLKPWLGTVRGGRPSDWTIDRQKMSNMMPSVHLELEHIHGYRARGVRSNIRFYDDSTLIFFAAAVGVVHDITNNSQFFYQYHTEDIVSLDYHPRRQLVATGAIGARATAQLCVWTIDKTAKCTRHLRCISGFLQYAVLACAFSSSGDKLAAVGMDENHTVAVYEWQTSTLLASSPAPGRNRIFQLSWMSPAHAKGMGVDADNYFVTAGWKHLYCWSLALSERKRLVSSKATLECSETADFKQKQMSFFANETFTSIAFTDSYVAVGATSGIVYLLRANEDTTQSAPVLRAFAIQNYILVHSFQKNVPSPDASSKPATRLQMMQRAHAAARSADVAELVDELTSLCLAFDGNSNAKIKVLKDELEKAQADVDAKLQEATELTKNGAVPLMKDFVVRTRWLIDVLTQLVGETEELWVDALHLGPPDSSEVASRLNGSNLTRTLQRITKGVQKRIGPLDVSIGSALLIKNVYLEVKKQWKSEVLRVSDPCMDALAFARQAAKDAARGEGQHDRPTGTTLQKGDIEMTDTSPRGISSLACFDDRFLLVGSRDGTVKMYDQSVSSKYIPQAVASTPAPTPTWSLDLSVHGLGANKSLREYDSIRAIAVNPSGTLFVAGTLASEVLTFTDPQGETVVHQEVVGHTGDLKAHLRRRNPAPAGYGELWGLAVHPFKRQMATATEDSTLRIWDADLRALVKQKRLETLAWTCCYSSDGDMIAVGFKNGSFAVFCSRTLRRLWPEVGAPLSESRYRSRRIEDIKFSPDGQFVALCSFNFLDVYRVTRTGKVILNAQVTYEGTCGGITSALMHFDWSCDSTMLQCVNRSYELLFFDITSKENFRFLQLTHAHALADEKWSSHNCQFGWNVQGIWSKFMDGTDINSCSRSNSDRYLLVGNDRHQVELYNYPCVGSGLDFRGRLRYRPEGKHYYGHASHVTSVQWLYDDSAAVTTGGNDCCVFQWKVIEDTTGVRVPVGDNDITPKHPCCRKTPKKPSTSHADTFPPPTWKQAAEGTEPSPTSRVPAWSSKKAQDEVRSQEEVTSPTTASRPRPHSRRWMKQQKKAVERKTSATLKREEAVAAQRKLFESQQQTETVNSQGGAKKGKSGKQEKVKEEGKKEEEVVEGKKKKKEEDGGKKEKEKKVRKKGKKASATKVGPPARGYTTNLAEEIDKMFGSVDPDTVSTSSTAKGGERTA